jgi:hypothetical protein
VLSQILLHPHFTVICHIRFPTLAPKDDVMLDGGFGVYLIAHCVRDVRDGFGVLRCGAYW